MLISLFPGFFLSLQSQNTSLIVLAEKTLNNFLLEVGVSPIKKTLTVDWDSSSERAKSDYIKKLRKKTTTINEVLSVLAPNQEIKLETGLLNQNSYQHGIQRSIANCFDSLQAGSASNSIYCCF